MGVGCAPWARPSLLNAALVGLSAAIWVVAVYLNNDVLFVWTEEEEYLHWIFVPAGIKILLVMLLGWRGAVGMMVGAIPGIVDSLPDASLAMIAVVSIGVGLMPWLALQAFAALVGIRYPWDDLVWWHLPALAALSAFANSAFLNVQLILLRMEPAKEFPQNLLSVMIGDFLGALVLLLVSVAIVRLLRRSRRPSS